jgi:hypothetical protein
MDLSLSDDQVTKIRLASEASWKMGAKLRKEETDPTALRAKMEGGRTQFEKQIMNVLTADQRALYEKMKGAEFAAPSNEAGL